MTAMKMLGDLLEGSGWKGLVQAAAGTLDDDPIRVDNFLTLKKFVP